MTRRIRGWTGLAALALAGCASPAPAAAPPSPPGAGGAAAPAPAPIVEDALPPEVMAIGKAFRENRFRKVHDGADAVLATVSDTETLRTLLYMAAVSDMMCRDYSATRAHADRFRDLPPDFERVEDSRDAWVHLAELGAYLAVVRSPEAVAETQTRIGVAVFRFRQLSDDPGYLRLCASTIASVPWTLDTGYVGKFVGDAALENRREQVEDSLDRAMRRVRARLGKGDLEFPPLTVRYEDGGPSRTMASMETFKFPISGHQVAVITVFTEALRQRPQMTLSHLTHELVHAVDAYDDSAEDPRWLTEGLAHWISDEGEQDLRRGAMSVAFNDLDAGARGLQNALEDPGALPGLPEQVQRIAGSFVFHHVERSRGLEVARRLALRLIETTDHRVAFQEVLASTAEDVLAEAGRELLPWFHRTFPRWAEVQEVHELQRRGASEEAIAYCDARFPQGDEDLESSAAALGRILALRDLERWDESLAGIRLLRESPHLLVNYSSLRYAEVKCLRRLERWEDVARFGRSAIRDAVWEDESQEAEIRTWVEEAEGKAK